MSIPDLVITETDIVAGQKVFASTEVARNAQITDWAALVTAQLNGQGSLPLGGIATYAGSSEPTGWLFCDGTAYNGITSPEYHNLFLIIGNTYGGTTEADFEVPNFIGRFIRGLDEAGDVDEDARTLGSTQADGIITHKHVTNSSASFASGSVNGGRGDQIAEGIDGYNTSGPTTIDSDVFIGLTETRPKNMAMNHIIRYA